MRRALIIAAAVCLLSSCGLFHKTPTVVVKDSVNVVNVFRDSVIIRDSTVLIPVEKVVDLVRSYDTLRMETSLARSTAYIDTTTHSLKGSLENKSKVQYIEREVHIIHETHDTLYKEKPVPYEVVKIQRKTPLFTKIMAWIGALLALAIIAKIANKYFI